MRTCFSRRFPALLAVLAVASGLLAQDAAAQAEAWVAPPSGSHTTTTFNVTVQWCSHDAALVASSRSILVAGVDVTADFSYTTGTYSGCVGYAESNGQVTIATTGTTTLEALINDALDQSAYTVVNYTYQAPVPMTVVFDNINNDHQKVGLCAAECFTPVIAKSTASYRSLGVDRAITLVHRGDRSDVRPLVSADLTFSPTLGPPTEVTLEAKVNGSRRTFVNGDTVLHFATSALLTGQAYRIAGQFKAQDLSTGMYPLQVTVTARYPDSSVESWSTPAGTKLMVVNANHADLLPFKGWTVAAVQRLYKQADTTALIVEGDGSGVYFACAIKTGASPCAGPSGDFSTLRRDGASYTRAYPDSTTVTFDSVGKMTALRDRWGSRTSFTYNGNGWIDQVNDPKLATYFAFSYGASDVRILLPGRGGVAPDSARRLRIAYDTTSGRVSSFQDRDGGTTQLTYDDSGRVSTVTNRRGGVTTFGYDAKTWKLTSVTLPAVPVDTGNGNTAMRTPTVHLTPWQTLAVPVATTVTTGAAPVRLAAAWAMVVGAVSDTTRFTADRWGQPLVTKDPLGNTTTSQRTGIFATSVTDALGQISTYGYTGPFLTSAKPAGQDSATTFQYDAWGMMKQVKAPKSPTMDIVYNPATKTIVQTVGGAYPDSTYLDSLGRPTRDVDARRHTTWFYYDSTFATLDSAVVHDSSVAGGYTGWRTILDGYGRDSLSRGYRMPIATRVYDVLGRDSLFYPNSGMQPVRFVYDSLFLVRTIDPKGQVYKTEFNALGWPTAVYDPGDTTKMQRFFYDVGGRVIRARNRNNADVVMGYDVAARLTSKRGNSANDSLQYIYAYSPTGQTIVGRTQSLDNTDVTVDSLRLGYAGADTVVTWIAGKRFKRVHTATVGTTADTTRLTFTDAGGSAVTGVPVFDRIRKWNSSTGMLDTLVLGAQRVGFGYDAERLLSAVKYPSFQLSLARNEKHLVTRRSYDVAVVDSLIGRTYNYSPLGTGGRISNEMWRSGVHTDGSPAYTTRGYDYDSVGTLKLYTRGRSLLLCPGCGTTIQDTAYNTYSYDAALNLAKDSASIGTVTSGSFDPGNRLRGWNGATYDFDAEGNRSAKHTGGVDTYYAWNAEGQLVGIRRDTSKVRYDYTAFGELFRRKTGGVIDRHYVWDQGQLVLVVDASGTTKVAEYAYTGTDQPIAVWTGTSSAPRFYEHDEREDVVAVTSNGSVTENRHFSPWGVEEFGATIPEDTRFGWKGLPWEGGTTQLYYVRNRWYDPQSRSFVSEDPLGVAGGTNTYAFAANDPVNGSDPSGLSANSGECVITVEYNYIEKNGIRWVIQGSVHVVSVSPECYEKTSEDDDHSAKQGGSSGGSKRGDSPPGCPIRMTADERRLVNNIWSQPDAATFERGTALQGKKLTVLKPENMFDSDNIRARIPIPLDELGHSHPVDALGFVQKKGRYGSVSDQDTNTANALERYGLKKIWAVSFDSISVFVPHSGVITTCPRLGQ